MFGHSIRLFRLFGFEIRIDASWLIIAALIVWSLYGGYFPQVLPGLAPVTYLALAMAAMLGLFASLILHELAHSIVARRYGLGIGGITLFLFGGVAELEEEPHSAASEFWIAVAGPAMSFLLSGIFGLASLAVAGPGAVAVLLVYLASINLVLAVFNLLPAFPLDGGRVFRAWLWKRSGDMLGATRKASMAGTFLALTLMGFGIFSALSGGGIGALWLALIGLFVLNASRGTYQRLLMQQSLRGWRVAQLMTPDPYTAGPDTPLDQVADRIMLAHAVSFVPVVERGIVLGYVDTALMQATPREDWARTPASAIMLPADDACLVSPRTTAEEALKRLAEGPHRKLIVTEGRQLRGILSLRDLMGHIAVAEALGPIGR